MIEDGLPDGGLLGFGQNLTEDNPKTSPTGEVLHELLFTGRQAGIHVLFDGHPITSALGPGGHEQFATVVLGQVTARIWDRLAPQTDTARKPSTQPGSFHVVQGWTTHESRCCT
ncbi:hypothetical protein [Streptomyces sp. NPDC014744]|uniref:hypothetical protein n=1 Tax=Streptomyces sp. NPDC014744 TaxID=3364903 RepID=UPI0036FAA9B9